MLKPYYALKASAGTGKTFALATRYAALLFLGAAPEKIYSLTFTNKAAVEMEERITSILDNLESKEAELNMIASLTDMDPKALLSARASVSKRFFESDRKIMTIDKFINLILRKFATNMGLLSDFDVEEIDKESTMKHYLNDVFHSKLTKNLVAFAVTENKKVEDVLDFFNALYEKDKELQNVIGAYDYEIDYSKIVYLEKEIMGSAERIKNIVHSNSAASASAKSGVEVSSMKELLARPWIERGTFQYSTYNKVFTPEMDTLLNDILTGLKNYFSLREAYFIKGLLDLYSHYKKTLQSNRASSNTLSFLDVTNTVYDLLIQEDIANDQIYFRLDGQIDHLLIDEFQDTSVVQYKILRPIIEEITSGVGSQDILRTFFYVGDVKQSIYRFRGANWSLFDYVAQAHNVEVENLDINFRSSQAVVNFANQTFLDIIPDFVKQYPREEASIGYVSSCVDADMIGSAFDQISTILAHGERPQDIAILVFTNNDVITMKEAVSRRFEGVEVVTDTSSKLVMQRCVKAIASFAKWLYFKEPMHLSTFKALMGVNPCEPYDAHFFDDFASMTPVELVKKIIDVFGLFDGDANMIKFVEQAKRYQDVEDFLFNYENDGESIVNSLGKEGITVLTIHKSKGLEFRNLIAMDRFTKPYAFNGNLIFDYDGIELLNIRYRFKNRESLDAQYAKVVANDNLLSDVDLFNTLYVALTRAKERLFINATTATYSAFKKIGLDKNETMGAFNEVAAVKVAEKEEGFQGSVEFVSLDYGRQEFVKKEGGKFEGEHNASHIYFGTALHYALEMAQSLNAESMPKALDATICRYGSFLSAEQINDLEKRCFTLVEHSSFKEMLHNAVEVKREYPVIVDGELGYIDLLIVKEDSCLVVDYKTGAESEEYHAQLNKYCAAVRAKCGEKSVEGMLAYVRDNSVSFVKGIVA